MLHERNSIAHTHTQTRTHKRGHRHAIVCATTNRDAPNRLSTAPTRAVNCWAWRENIPAPDTSCTRKHDGFLELVIHTSAFLDACARSCCSEGKNAARVPVFRAVESRRWSAAAGASASGNGASLDSRNFFTVGLSRNPAGPCFVLDEWAYVVRRMLCVGHQRNNDDNNTTKQQRHNNHTHSGLSGGGTETENDHTSSPQEHRLPQCRQCVPSMPGKALDERLKHSVLQLLSPAPFRSIHRFACKPPCLLDQHGLDLLAGPQQLHRVCRAKARGCSLVLLEYSDWTAVHASTCKSCKGTERPNSEQARWRKQTQNQKGNIKTTTKMAVSYAPGAHNLLRMPVQLMLNSSCVLM